MSLKEELLNAAKPFLMKEGLESSKEIIATNSTSFDEMGMANSKPGEFAPEEITDPENLVNVSKMANDNNFNAEAEESETVVSILGIDDAGLKELGDLVNLGTGASCECNDPQCRDCKPRLANVIESILKRKDKLFLENLSEAEELEEAPVDDWPGFVPAQPGIGKWATALMSRIRANASAIKDGRIQVPDNIKQNWQKYVDAYKQYNISNIGSPKYNTILRAVAAKSSNPQMIENPTEEDCAALSSALNAALKKEGENALPFDFEPGFPLNNTLDKSSKNYQNRSMFVKAYADANASGDIKRGSYSVLNTFDEPAEAPAVEEPVAAAPAMADEDVALLQQHGIDPNNPDAAKIVNILKQMNPAPAAKKPVARKGKLAKALESVLTEKMFGDSYSVIQASKTLEDAKAYKGQYVIMPDSEHFTLTDDIMKATQFKTKDVEETIQYLHSGNANCDFDSKSLFYTPMNADTIHESVKLKESDYAGNLSYNPDKRLNASDILNAVKNAVKPELAAALSIVKNVDANEEPIYSLQNIDEKDLPEKLEIDTNTDKKVVLKKDGNSYKFDK